jgi:hypothetical protein
MFVQIDMFRMFRIAVHAHQGLFDREVGTGMFTELFKLEENIGPTFPVLNCSVDHSKQFDDSLMLVVDLGDAD